MKDLFWTVVTIASFPTSRAIILLCLVVLVQRRRRRPRTPSAA